MVQIGRSIADRKRLNDIEELIDKLLTGKSYLSHSSFSAFMKSPAHFIEYKFGEREQKQVFKDGNLVDCLLLEREKFDERYIVFDREEILPFPDKNYQTKANREARDEFLATVPKNISVIEPDALAEAEQIVSSVINTSAAKGLLDFCDTCQEKLNFDFEGFKWIGFKDASSSELTIDLKTSKDASFRGMKRAIIKYGYDRQAALYNIGDGNLHKPYFIIAVEKAKPFPVGIHHLTEKTLENGMQKIMRGLSRFKECLIDESKFLQSYEFWANKSDGIFEMEIY